MSKIQSIEIKIKFDDGRESSMSSGDLSDLTAEDIKSLASYMAENAIDLSADALEARK